MNKGKALKRVILSIAALALVIVALAVSPYVYDNVYLSGMERGISKVDNVDGVDVLETKGICGRLNGNGNGMQFLAAALIKVDDGVDTEDIIEQAEASCKSASYCKVMEYDGGELSCQELERGRLTFESEIDDTASYYILYVYGANNSLLSSLDIRGH